MEFTKEEINMYTVFSTAIVNLAIKHEPNDNFIKSVTGHFKSKGGISGKQLGALINMIGLDQKSLHKTK